MKSALFVDFDNVYSGLRRLDQGAADQFARMPTAWMNWLIESLELPAPTRPGARRRILVRRCYLNPQAYQRFRPSFNLAGFEIVDCPPMTTEGKTSTDIHMVLDIVDLLQQETHYDEFIVFSADADFTPLLRKLRRWDRRTTVLAIGFPSAAYRASADLLIDQDDFIREALSFGDALTEPPPVEIRPARTLASSALAVIREAVQEAPTPVPLAKIASALLRAVDGLDASSWGGLGSFRALLDSLDLTPLAVSWEGGGTIYDPKRHSRAVTHGTGASGGKLNGVQPMLEELIRAEVAKASQPVPCGRLATLILGQDGSLAADWAGKGTFRKFVESLNVLPVRFNWNASGGFAVDPSRHTVPSDVAVDPGTEWADNALYEVAKHIHDLTDVPLLSPKKYRNLMEVIASDVLGSPFHLVATGKRVRDRCRDSGLPVSRADVNHVLRGLLMRGHSFEEGSNDAPTLCRKLADSIRSLCLREEIMLDAAMVSAIDNWIGGGAAR
ncbi:NYN domain-containing protein [Candidatus Accumulibacter sp. ACC003]|uniref:NYN domain-containing protein n=1 Tax=Candidatus Accumulibacter sp. ACC003 TaxID=2823334 RepID=UPI0025B7C06D|nr:NYN domain-containing protein [Candidatus Accumulibacter sp. ACC003]